MLKSTFYQDFISLHTDLLGNTTAQLSLISIPWPQIHCVLDILLTYYLGSLLQPGLRSLTQLTTYNYEIELFINLLMLLPKSNRLIIINPSIHKVFCFDG